MRWPKDLSKLRCDPTKGRVFDLDGNPLSEVDASGYRPRSVDRANDRMHRMVRIEGRYYLVHHLILALSGYDCSSGDVHHLDGDKANNALQNLLICTRSQHSSIHSLQSAAGTLLSDASKYKSLSFKYRLQGERYGDPLRYEAQVSKYQLMYELSAQEAARLGGILESIESDARDYMESHLRLDREAIDAKRRGRKAV